MRKLYLKFLDHLVEKLRKEDYFCKYNEEFKQSEYDLEKKKKSSLKLSF
jgi:hypothetical protein